MLLLLFLHPFVLSMVLVDTIINKTATYFHKTISSNKTSLVYWTIHFCHCQELSDKTK